MKRNIWCLLAALLAWGGFTAQAEARGDGWYVAPKLGASVLSGDNTLDAGHADIAGRSEYSESVSKLAPAGALAIGYDFSGYGGPPVRTEVEFTMRTPFKTEEEGDGPLGDYKTTQKATIQTLMLNTYLDFKSDASFTPYIGAGLGAALIKGESTYTLADGNFTPDGASNEASSDLQKFAFSLTAGGAWELTEGLALDLGYRYFHVGNLSLGDHSPTTFKVPQGEGENFDEEKGNGPEGEVSFKKAGLHEVMLGLRFSY